MSVKVKIKVDNKNEYISLPTIALNGLVVFPNSMVHFDVGREKSIMALDEAMENDRKIFLVPQLDLNMDYPTKTDTYEVGVIGEVKQILKLREGVV
ncbi:MAG: LON peptidase substrate-binding domain-containing protein, partial [Oscillospiraceae bacterium]